MRQAIMPGACAVDPLAVGTIMRTVRKLLSPARVAAAVYVKDGLRHIPWHASMEP